VVTPPFGGAAPFLEINKERLATIFHTHDHVIVAIVGVVGAVEWSRGFFSWHGGNGHCGCEGGGFRGGIRDGWCIG
jgi:hypothetical protein